MKKCPYCSNPVYAVNARRCAFCGRNLDFELAKKLERERAEREHFFNASKSAFLALAFLVLVTAATLWAAIYSPVGTIAKQAATQTAAARRYCDPQEVSIAAHQLIDFNDRWADIMALAVSVDHDDALVLQVDRLQKIRRDAEDVKTPECLKAPQQNLINGMEDHIQGLLMVLRDQPLDEANRYLTLGNLKMNEFADEVERIQVCAPDCR